MNTQEREAVKIMAREEARKRIAGTNQTRLRMTARIHRNNAAKLWESGELSDMVQAMWELSEATRIETYLDCLRSEDHPMWECIMIDRLREKGSEQKRKPRNTQWIPDPMRGYNGRECTRFIHEGTQKIARLTFR